MAALDNLGFETEGASPGLAAAWSVDSFSALTYADFPVLGYESFEELWDSNEDYVFAFTLVNTTPAEYLTFIGSSKFYEDFEELWSNDSYIYTLVATAAASYDVAPQAFEDFEEDWSSNQSYVFTFSGFAAPYNSPATESSERFEENWDDLVMATI